MYETDPKNPFHITSDHYAAFGKIINSLAEMETMVDGAVTLMIERAPELIIPLLSMLAAKQKRDFVAAVAAESNLVPDAQAKLVDLMKKVEGASKMRNLVAHNGWAEGETKGRIKPFTMRVTDKIKFGGNKDGEVEYSAQELHNIAKQNYALGLELISFMRSQGLMRERDGS